MYFFFFLRFSRPDPVVELTGKMAKNTYLNGAARMWAGRIDGPECLLARGSEIYASQRGQVVKINGEHITHVARFGQACGQCAVTTTRNNNAE